MRRINAAQQAPRFVLFRKLHRFGPVDRLLRHRHRNDGTAGLVLRWSPRIPPCSRLRDLRMACPLSPKRFGRAETCVCQSRIRRLPRVWHGEKHRRGRHERNWREPGICFWVFANLRPHSGLSSRLRLVPFAMDSASRSSIKMICGWSPAFRRFPVFRLKPGLQRVRRTVFAVQAG